MKKHVLSLGLLCTATSATAHEPPAAATVAELTQMAQRFSPAELRADTSKLSPGDKAAIVKLLEAAKLIDVLQLRQRWDKNEALWAALQNDNSPLGKARQNAFWLNKGPWSVLDENKSFLPTELAGIKIPSQKPESGNFYPSGVSKQAIETWMQSLSPTDKEQTQ